MVGGTSSLGGSLSAKLIKGVTDAPLAWKLRNVARWGFIKGWLFWHLAWAFSRLTEIPTVVSSLSIRVRKANGEWIDYGTVCYRVVTDAGVAFIVDDMDNSTTDITTLNYHGVGTGGTAESAAQTALVTESTTALNPDNTRATGTKTQPSANILRSVGTVTFDASAAITEHGIFSQAATGGGTLLDRSLFSAINVASADSINFCGFAA
jgi:hypothetical protein